MGVLTGCVGVGAFDADVIGVCVSVIIGTCNVNSDIAILNSIAANPKNKSFVLKQHYMGTTYAMGGTIMT
jgi:sorbitol-specific phosphotransferase system component IIBC